MVEDVGGSERKWICNCCLSFASPIDFIGGLVEGWTLEERFGSRRQEKEPPPNLEPATARLLQVRSSRRHCTHSSLKVHHRRSREEILRALIVPTQMLSCPKRHRWSYNAIGDSRAICSAPRPFSVRLPGMHTYCMLKCSQRNASFPIPDVSLRRLQAPL